MIGASAICLENTYWVTGIKEQANVPGFGRHRNWAALRSPATDERRSPEKNFAPTIFCLSLSPVSFQIPGEIIWPSLSVSTIEPISLGQGMDQLTQAWPWGLLRAAMHDYEYGDRFANFFIFLYVYF